MRPPPKPGELWQIGGNQVLVLEAEFKPDYIDHWNINVLMVLSKTTTWLVFFSKPENNFNFQGLKWEKVST